MLTSLGNSPLIKNLNRLTVKILFEMLSYIDDQCLMFLLNKKDLELTRSFLEGIYVLINVVIQFFEFFVAHW